MSEIKRKVKAMKKRHFFLIILLSAGLMYAKSAHSQRLNYVPVENLDSLCSRFNEQVDGIYTGKLT
ncbi:MAG: hypothetical protein Q8K93_07220, partial [Reyranella sp.]|nr:hypothetical protein [Reyranella sp.]